MMFSRLWLKNIFFTKSLMGTPLDWSFFTHFFCFQFGFRAHLAVQINFFFGTIKDLPIWFFGNEGILVSQNSYGNTMVWNPISSDFFDFARVDRKSIKIGYKPDRKQLGRFKSFWLVQKSYGHGFFYVSTPFLLVRAGWSKKLLQWGWKSSSE